MPFNCEMPPKRYFKADRGWRTLRGSDSMAESTEQANRIHGGNQEEFAPATGTRHAGLQILLVGAIDNARYKRWYFR